MTEYESCFNARVYLYLCGFVCYVWDDSFFMVDCFNSDRSDRYSRPRYRKIAKWVERKFRDLWDFEEDKELVLIDTNHDTRDNIYHILDRAYNIWNIYLNDFNYLPIL